MPALSRVRAEVGDLAASCNGERCSEQREEGRGERKEREREAEEERARTGGDRER